MENSLDLQCLDIGNTSSNLGIYTDKELIEVKSFKTKNLFSESVCFKKYILPQNGPLVYCSVVPQAEYLLQKKMTHFPHKIYSVDAKNCANLPISYENPKEVGPDRIANSIAAFNQFELPAIVVDTGTATTFDIIYPKKGYVGGIILPGPQGFLDFLHDHTALLPKITLNNHLTGNLAYGKNTEEAMQLGVKLGYSQMIKSIISKTKENILKEIKVSPSVTLTGGYDLKLRMEDFSYNPYLTLLGLRITFEKLKLLQ